MRSRSSLTTRPVRALLVSAVVVAGCAHAPAREADARREPSAASGEARADRVLVTGSRLPRPVGRDGLPVTDSPVKIYWRDDFVRTGHPDLARAIRNADIDAR